jgi:hypothetical protein
VGRRGVKSSFKLFLPVFATRSEGGEGIRGLWEEIVYVLFGLAHILYVHNVCHGSDLRWWV